MKAKFTQSTTKVKIELTESVLAQLIISGLLRGSECKCLDSNAKKVMWQALLASSLHNEGMICT